MVRVSCPHVLAITAHGCPGLLAPLALLYYFHSNWGAGAFKNGTDHVYEDQQNVQRRLRDEALISPLNTGFQKTLRQGIGLLKYVNCPHHGRDSVVMSTEAKGEHLRHIQDCLLSFSLAKSIANRRCPGAD